MTLLHSHLLVVSVKINRWYFLLFCRRWSNFILCYKFGSMLEEFILLAFYLIVNICMFLSVSSNKFDLIWYQHTYNDCRTAVCQKKTRKFCLSKSNFKDQYGDTVITQCLGKIVEINEFSAFDEMLWLTRQTGRQHVDRSNADGWQVSITWQKHY